MAGRVSVISLEDEINRIRAESTKKSEEANKARADNPGSAAAVIRGAVNAGKGSRIPKPRMSPIKKRK